MSVGPTFGIAGIRKIRLDYRAIITCSRHSFLAELSDRQGRLIVQYDDIDDINEDICVYRGSHVYQLNLENLGYGLVILLPETPITIADGLDTDYWNKADRDRCEYAPISSHWRPLKQSKSPPSPRFAKELFVRLRKSLI